MKIDIGKVNLAEKDIEDWLFGNPSEIPCETEYYNETPIVRWIGRQYHLPSGIADLIGVRENGKVVLIEIKNVAIGKAAVLQVCRYASDIESILDQREYRIKGEDQRSCIDKIVIGPSIDSQTMLEARACDVSIIQFDAHLTLELGTMGFTSEAEEARDLELEKLSQQPEWNVFGIHCKEYVYATPGPDDLSEDEKLNLIFGVPLGDCESKETNGDENP